MVVRRDDVQKEKNDHKGVVGLADAMRELFSQTLRSTSRQPWRDGEFAVPQSTVMGADIAHMGQMVKPGFQESLVKLVYVGYCATGGHWSEVAVPAGKLTQRHNFANNPNRRQRFGVLQFVVTDKDFSGAFNFFLKCLAVFVITRAPMGQSRIQVGVRPVTVSHLVSPLAAHRHFDSFNGVKNQKAQFAIENIEVQNFFELGASPKAVRCMVCFERQPIADKPIVIQVLKIKFGLARVIDYHAALAQQRHLLSITRSRFSKGARHYPPHKTK